MMVSLCTYLLAKDEKMGFSLLLTSGGCPKEIYYMKCSYSD